MITRSKTAIQDHSLPDRATIEGALQEHAQEVERLTCLRRYYEGETAILQRYRESGMPNNRIAHAYCRYIVAITTGYLIGKPVSYTTTAPGEGFQKLLQTYRQMSISSIDAELARNAAIFGKAVEYIHTDEEGELRTASLDPRDAFVVYDDTCDAKPLFGVYITAIRDRKGHKIGSRVFVMGKEYIAEYRMDAMGTLDAPQNVERHFFGGVPMVEYWNDENEKGDFEWVLPLVDAYDRLESDRMNDKDQFVDALLVLTGCTLETDERGREPWRQLREDKALCLPDSGAGVNYLHNAMDEAGNQILRDALAEDIHKFSMVPDLTDKNFAENASGVAMRYKLWGLEQLANVKQQWFTEGLRSRMKLIFRYLLICGYDVPDVSDVNVLFTRSLPSDRSEIADFVRSAGDSGAMSRETMIRTLHEGEEWTQDDIQKEEAKIDHAR